MDLILCHTTADFDTLGAAVGLSRLKPGARIVLTGGCHPAVQEFLALHRDEYPLIERRSVNPATIRSLSVVDTQWRDRLGKAAEWLTLPGITIAVYDHHVEAGGDIEAAQTQVEPVGAVTTLMVEALRSQQVTLNPIDATVMALGIHVDTGSLTFDHSTARDAAALTWLMEQGANLRAIAEYVEPGLSPLLQDLLPVALDQLQDEVVQGLAIAWVLLPAAAYIPGLSNLASRILSLTESDVLLLAVRYPCGDPNEERLTVIGRLRGGSSGGGQLESLNLGELFAALGGGGHPKAAAVTLRTSNPADVVERLLQQIRARVPQPPLARELMSSPVRTIRPDTSIAEAQRILLRYGHSGLSVVDAQDQLVGIISRRDIDIALHHGFSHAPVKGYMTPNLKTIAPDTALPDIEDLMVTYDIGRLPVLDDGQLVGIVTRTDVLRQLHQQKAIGNGARAEERALGYCPMPETVRDLLRDRLTPSLWQVLAIAAEAAEQRGWQLYLVGGAVRDLLLAGPDSILTLDDIDLVVDGFHRAADQEAGVELARVLCQRYPQARLQIHGRFQTAALLWHHDPDLDSLWIDIATARTEFYPYPAANPEVEASSIRQDLYRRDFTINALAVRLTAPHTGELLDFFGGLMDLQTRQIRVLHANSFIEDPTRIFRAVRFAVRLGFQLEPSTEGYIHHAIASGIYHRIQTEMTKTPALQTRLRRELHYILEAPYWKAAVRLLADLGALRCLHSSLELSDDLWRQLGLGDRWLKRFDRQLRLDHWLVLLEVLIAHLEPDYRHAVATHLQLPAPSIERLSQLATLQASVNAALTEGDRPSQIVQALKPHDLGTLTLLGIKSPRPVRKLIWQYLTHWAQLKPLLDGNALKALGYKPGRQFKQILETLLAATLDGEIATVSQAEAFLAHH
ncbi:MAG TPA: CBS domain-containing protein, partial [Chroococcidiopsis sp.]